MNYQQLLEMQEQLDQHIMKKRNLQFIKLQSLALALSTEISEVANAFQRWKYWKTNNEPKSELLEEVADALHFLLSISYRFKIDGETISKLSGFECKTVEEQFLFIQHTISQTANYGNADDKRKYIHVTWILFKGLLNQLGFTETDIYKAYLKKNQKNYERQANNY